MSEKPAIYTLAQYASLAESATHWRKSEVPDSGSLTGVLPLGIGNFFYMNKPQLYGSIWVGVETPRGEEVDSLLVERQGFKNDLDSARRLVHMYRRALLQASNTKISARIIKRESLIARTAIDELLSRLEE